MDNIESCVPVIIKENEFDSDEYFNEDTMDIKSHIKFQPNVYVSKSMPILRYREKNDGLINVNVKQLTIEILSGEIISMEGAVEPFMRSFRNMVTCYVINSDDIITVLDEKVAEFFLFEMPEMAVSLEGIIIAYTYEKLMLSLDGINWFDVPLPEECDGGTIYGIEEVGVAESGANVIIFDVGDDYLCPCEFSCEVNLLDDSVITMYIQ